MAKGRQAKTKRQLIDVRKYFHLTCHIELTSRIYKIFQWLTITKAKESPIRKGKRNIADTIKGSPTDVQQVDKKMLITIYHQGNTNHGNIEIIILHISKKLGTIYVGEVVV